MNDRVLYRKAQDKDINQIVKLEHQVWGKNGATHEMVKSRIETFKEGTVIAVIDYSKVVGVVFFQIINYGKLRRYRNWYQYTDNGLIENTHSFQGDTIFGIGLSVSPNYRGLKIGTGLVREVEKEAVKYKIQRGILGARIPDYHKYLHLNPAEYVHLRASDGQLVDPELRFYERLGLSVVKIMPNYFTDQESADYGVLLQWLNPYTK